MLHLQILLKLCQGMLVHSFDKLYVVPKFILPSINDLKFSTINFDETCDYLKEENGYNYNSKEYISNLRLYCKTIAPFIHYNRKQISSYNCTAHNILINEISLILPNFLKTRQEKRSIIALLLSGFKGLVYEDISCFLHNRRHKALHKAVMAMENKVNVQCNKLMHIEDSMVMCDIYSAETLEKLITTVYKMHNITVPN